MTCLRALASCQLILVQNLCFFYVGYIETCSLHLFVFAAFFPISCKACISVTADWRFVLLVYLHSNIFKLVQDKIREVLPSNSGATLIF